MCCTLFGHPPAQLFGIPLHNFWVTRKSTFFSPFAHLSRLSRSPFFTSDARAVVAVFLCLLIHFAT